MKHTDLWHRFDNGSTLGQPGSEGGRTLLDEEHPAGSRITLEQGSHAPFAITCSACCTMVHTCLFGSEPDARAAYDRMKPRLVEIADAMPTDIAAQPAQFDAAVRLMEQFVADFDS